MPDKSKKFHEFALKSILFKGRTDWYFCYLKTERIAHVLSLLGAQGGSPRLRDIAHHAQTLPADIARLAGGELGPAGVLSEVFALLAGLRMAATDGLLTAETALVLVREYEHVAEKLVAGSHPSPFVGPEDFFVPELHEAPLQFGHGRPVASLAPQEYIKDIKDKPVSNKGHNGQNDRTTLILSYIRKHKGSSIKEISAMVPGCSEQTVQRELNGLIAQGLVRRVGSRRWSLYEPA